MSDLNVRPTGHFVLVEMIEVKNKSEGGIILGSTDKEQSATEIGVVRAIGPTAFYGVAGCNPSDYPTGHDFYRMEPHQIWGIAVGDMVHYARYEGQPVKLKGYERHRYIPDITIKGVLSGEIELSKTDF